MCCLHTVGFGRIGLPFGSTPSCMSSLLLGGFKYRSCCCMLLLLLVFLTLSDWCFGTMEFYDCPYIIIDWEWNVIIPTGPFIFFRGLGEKPPSSFVLFPGMEFRICPARHLEDDTGCFVSRWSQWASHEHKFKLNMFFKLSHEHEFKFPPDGSFNPIFFQINSPMK